MIIIIIIIKSINTRKQCVHYLTNTTDDICWQTEDKTKLKFPLSNLKNKRLLNSIII